MDEDPQVRNLLEEALNSGRTPDEVCAARPDLLHEVRARWLRIRALSAELERAFPSSGRTATHPRQTGKTSADLPRIPGYELQEIIGAGGMGVVYRARHVKLNRTVAIKMLLAGGHAGPREVERFKREAEAVAALRHPNIVQVHDAGEHDGRPYFTMELVEGLSLADFLAGVPQSAAWAAETVGTLARAVHAAHAAGIVHRDLKPANILLGSDGTVKITDFGLARHFDGSAGPTITLTGERVGTPSYMAPEQALGTASAMGPAVDIYALGAILYEMLTGRPPFRAESPLETQRQVVEQEPVAPSRLNARVPRDLETTCLKCLQKAASRRYGTARDLADDLRRFLNHEPILARRIGRTARVLRWIRRKPTAAALLTTVLALVGLAIGAGVQRVQQQAERRAELRTGVGTAVAQAQSLRKGFHFQEARALLERARQSLEPAGSDDLRRQVDQEQADMELVENLDTARLRAAMPVEWSSGAKRLYEETLARAGLGRLQEDSAIVAERVRASSVRAEIVAALDDWAGTTQDESRRVWLLAVARAADPDPSRERLRQPQLWRDALTLTRLAQEVPVDELSPQLLTALGRALRTSGGDAVPLLSAAQAHYPQDFWLNFELGGALYDSERNEEALGFYRAALARRPESGHAYHGVGLSLNAMGRLDEGIGNLQHALGIDRNDATVHNNLGTALTRKGQLHEAMSHFQESIRLDPQASATAHQNLGGALSSLGRLDEAISHFQESIRLDPQGSARAHHALGHAMTINGRQDDAIRHYQESMRRDPKPSAGAHHNLGVALSELGRLDEAISYFQEAIRLDPQASAAAHNSLGLALRSKGRLDEAIDHLQESIRLDPKTSATAHYNLGVALREKGQAAREEERAGLRRHMLDWLRAGLELRNQYSKEGKAADWSLTAWQTDPALAGVRDRQALAELPDAERQEWERLWADVAAVLAADTVEHAWAHAARRDWAGAADSYARVLGPGATDDGHRWFEYAAVLLLSGDRAGYAKACARMVERHGDAPGLRAYHVARACTLAPDAVSDASLPGRLAESELRSAVGQFWSLTQQGALHYRAGRFPEAVALFEQSLAADTRPGRAVLNWLWLALADERLGKSEEARRWLNTATAWLDQFRDGLPSRAEEELGLHLHNWLEAHILRREAEAIVQFR